ncbi:MAG: hydroxyethylthiazole kinase [Oscillospiraceae bacterium]
MPDFARLDAVRRRRPLIHCISNIVAANDCANLVLAVGASPMMAQAPEEMEEIAAASAAAVLNTGTPSEEKFRACLLCGREMQRLGRPVVLDPVGVGASAWRLGRVKGLLAAFTPAILRVNLGEAQALGEGSSREQGVDSPAPATREQRLASAMELARRYHAAVLLSGPEDIVTDGVSAWLASGGSAEMSRVTGTGCMLSVLCGVFAAVEEDPLEAAALAAAFWKVCSQRAERAAEGRGSGSFRAALLDAAGTLSAADFAAEARLERLL